MRYFIELCYDGTHYHGWQIQNNAQTVQQVLNDSLSTILRQEIQTVGSGRTDTGVHASHQVAHFDYPETLEDNFCHKLNSLLPNDISAKTMRRVHDHVSARFDAVSRAYVYKISKVKNPFEVNRAYVFHRPLDISLMNDCIEILKNWKDFESFSKVKTDVNTFDCQIFEAKWDETNESLSFYVSANRFLRGMVRAMVGTLLLVGERKIDLEGFQQILTSKDRKKAGSAVPAHGLYLCEVNYPKEVYI